ncbi:hypothetical protein O3M35_002066 [Rhynocoris fuscipes]|uniref:Ig-like domain-containing protein n=1 Tax=Rhynocoris fuscipes TaxID=488301 RepID=A0AAW1CR55_9HEMI
MLQVRDWLELKVVEVTPSLTQLADTLSEARDLQDAHTNVIQKIKSKKSPVSELADQAQNILQTQNTSPKVYAAMTDSLSTVWQNVNNHLELRANILHLNVAYHTCAETFNRCCDRLENLCNSELPVEIEEMNTTLENLKDYQKECLVTMNQALHQGATLVELMDGLSDQGSLDSRPQHIRLQAQLAKVQVEQWMETLHLRRQVLFEKTERCRIQLEQCLELARITVDLTVLKRLINDRTESLLSSMDQLGDAHASSQLLLHEHKKIVPEAKDMQEHALKIVKATEDFAASGHFAGPDAIKEAYLLLELAATYLHRIEQKETTLQTAIDFFNAAQSALIKLDQLEVQLTTGDLGLSSSQLAQLHLNISRSLDEVTQEPLQQGYKLLEEVPTAEGVKRMVERLENKKINLSVQCTAHKEENLKANQMYSTFTDKYNMLRAYITSMEEYVRGVREMGENLSSAKEYLQTYKKNLNDLQTKGTEITALVSTIPNISDMLDPTRANEVKEKGDELRIKWSTLMVQLEKRIRYCTTYVKALDLGSKAISELDAVEKDIEKADEPSAVNQNWVSCQQLKVQFDNIASNFINDASLIAGEANLDAEGARQCLNKISTEIQNRIKRVEEAWQRWESDKQTRERDRQLWTNNMAATNQTVDWVSKLDAQLYPVLNAELQSARQLVNHVEEKINTVLPEIKRAQQEIQLRIDTAEALITRVDVRSSSEGVPVRLKELNNKLHSISAEYQVLLEKLLTFFQSLSQVENRIESIQREYHAMPTPQNLSEAKKRIRDFETAKHAVTEMFNMCLIDSGHIINKIRAQESSNGNQDVRTVERAVENLRTNWQKICTENDVTLSRYEAHCKFYDDLEQINASIDQLSGQLSQRKGRYGDSLAASKDTSQAFNAFENTIKLAEDRVMNFIKSSEELLGSEHGEQIGRDLQHLRLKWIALLDQVKELRRLINLSIEFFTLVEEAENWFREGNRMLLTIAQRTAQVKTPEEANSLLHDIQVFLKPGEEAQNKRIEQITKLAEQLYGDITTSHARQVKSDSQDVIRSFNLACSELKSLATKLKAPSPLPIIELMETDEPSTRTESWEDRTQQIVTTHLTNISEHREIHTTFVQHQREEEMTSRTEAIERQQKKSPSPPTKKKKYLFQKAEDEGKAPYFTSPLEDAVVEEGNKLILKCRVNGEPIPEITWEKDGLLIENNPDYQMRFTDGLCTLTIEETFAEDSARFTCKANNFAGSAETTCSLTVKESQPEGEVTPPVFITPLSTVTCVEGEKLELKCLVGGAPLPVVQWYRGDTCLDNEPNLLITYNNGEAILVKQKTELSDKGEYRCVATNPAGTEKSVAKVNVQRMQLSELPVFTLELSNVMARAGQKIKLECEVKGNPTPKLIWTKDGIEIPENTRDIKITTEGGCSSLVIPEAFLKDAGLYTVIASSPAGEVRSVSQVTVKGRLPPESSDTEQPSDMEPVKPSVQIHLRDQSVFEGKKVRLDCVIVGTPEPEVIWYHNGQPVKESAEFQLIFHGDRCSLIIQEALLEDAGNYKVVAINSAGEASSQCLLNVQAVDKGGVHATREPAEAKVNGADDKAIDGAPKFTQLLSDMLVVAGDTVTMECTVIGQPPPTVTWALNNKEVQQSERIHMSQDADGHCTLRITNVSADDKGVYTAKAANQQGECKCFSHLNVKTPLLMGAVQTQQVEEKEKTCPPSFSQLFADVTVPDGGHTKFECIVTGKPTPKVKWLFNDQPVSGKDFLVSTSGNRQVLSLPRVTKALAGKITCQAENEAGRATCVAIVNVSEPTMQTEMQTIDDLNLNESGVFEMKRAVFMESSSTSQFSSTTSQTGRIEPVVNIQAKSTKSEFASHKIGDKPAVQVESHKTSEYKNIGGMESKEETNVTKTSGLEKSSSAVVIGKRKNTAPRFVAPINGCIVDQGAEVVLTAIIEGYPTPDISWSRNGGVCPQESEISWESGKSQLKIRNIKTVHGGRYSCTASNVAGTATSSADVVVKKTSFPPVMGRRLQARTAIVGERVALEIEVTGIPTPTITWYKDGQQIKHSTVSYRLESQGNCHSLIIDKVDHKHTGQYSVSATNAAGEAKSTADLLIMDPVPEPAPQPELSTHFQTDFKGVETQLETIGVPRDQNIKTITTTIPVPGGKVFVEESFKSEKHVEMKVKQSSQTVSDIFEVKSKPAITEQFPEFVPPPSIIETPKQEATSTESISTKSAIDFFKSIIKENEEESKKKYEPKPEPVKTIQYEKKIIQEKEISQQSFNNFKTPSFDKQWSDEIDFSDLHLEPGPPPEMGYIPKSSVVRQKDEMATRVKKLEESHRNLSEREIPSGAVKIFPVKTPEVVPPKKEEKLPIIPPVIEKKTVPDLWEGKKEVVEEVIVAKKVQPPGLDEQTLAKHAFKPVTPPFQETFAPPKPTTFASPPKPSTFVPSPIPAPAPVERPWTTKWQEEVKPKPFMQTDSSFKSTFSSVKSSDFQTLSSSPILERPKSPLPSAEGLAMDKLWAHKHTESSLPSVWPPPNLSQTVETETSSIRKESQVSNVSEFKKTTSNVSLPPPSMQEFSTFTPIYYIAETHTTHKAKLDQFSRKSDFSEMTEEKNVITERTIHPSEAKKIFEVPSPPQPVAPAKPQPKKEIYRPQPQPIQPLDISDIGLEPGPPPEIGYAVPPPKERRQSYVEMIEQDLEKDLDKEPTKRLVGAVRTMPPPKKESSVERQKSVQTEKFEQKTMMERRSTSLVDNYSRTFPTADSYQMGTEQISTATKFSTIPRPSKFSKKSVNESDYESDLEGTRIKPRWTPWESDTEEPHYRKVKPPEFTEQPKRAKSVQPEPTLPLDQPPLIISSKSITTSEKQTKQKFESHFKSTTKKTDAISISTSSTLQPKKPGSPPKPDSPKSKKKEPAPPDGYAADTDEPQNFYKQKITAAHHHQQAERISSFQQQHQHQQIKQEKKPQQQHIPTIPKDVPITTPLEPFPFKPAGPSRPVQITVPLPASPAKFIKGEFKESDYESDYETKIPPVWTPSPIMPEMSFRPVHPHLSPVQPSQREQTREPTPPSQFDKGPIRPTPQTVYGPPVNAVETSNTMRFAESTSSSRRVVSMQQTTRVVSFDQKKATRQTSLPTKFVPKGEAKWMSDSESETVAKSMAEEKRLQRVEEMRKRFGEKSSQSLIDLKPGEPPTFDYAPPRMPAAASTVAGKHLSEMGSAFKSKAQQFVSEIVTDVKQDIKQKKAPILKKKEEEPEIYREESRVAEHGISQWTSDTSSPMPLTSPIVVNAMLHSDQPKKAPIFITPLRDIAVVSGQTARFECIVQAEPTPNIIWAKDGRIIEESLNHEIQFRNGVCRLTIPQAFSYDAGTYSCTATNNVGTQTTSSTLQVPGERRTYISK